VFTVEPPFNSENDRVYAPIDNKRYINPSRLLRMAVMVSVAVSQVGMTEVIFVNRCLNRCFQQSNVSQNVVYSQNVAYGEIGHFLCSVISQGKVVALDR